MIDGRMLIHFEFQSVRSKIEGIWE